MSGAEHTPETAAPAVAEKIEQSDFAKLLAPTFSPRTPSTGNAIQVAVQTLAEQALASTTLIPVDALDAIEAMIKDIDSKLTAQVNTILHHEDFQKLESAWRGLSYLVSNTETDETLKIKFLNVSKVELSRELKKFKNNAWDQSPIHKKIYEEEFGQLGGEPYGLLVGDYYFDHHAPDVQLLSDLSKIAAASHAPFIAGASPDVMGMASWTELTDKRDLTGIFLTPEYAAWRSLRDSEDSRYIGLAMPRFLARLPYGQKTDPVEAFAFEEDTAAGNSSNYSWANSAYAMATNITQSFKVYGWTTQICGVESGGAVLGLPTHTFLSDDGGMVAKCPTEIAISDRREKELAKNGFMPLLHEKRTDSAVFMGAQSLQQPAKYDDPAATANAKLAARLPYLFATCRFGHYLKKMVRSKVGSKMTEVKLESWLQTWLNKYVDASPDTSSEDWKAEHPLAEGRVEVKPNPEDPGYYSAKFFLKPHYQLEGMTVSLRLVSRMPKENA